MQDDFRPERSPLERWKLELTPPLVWTGALPLALLIFEGITLVWHWKGKCSSYGFPMPYLEWAGSSLEWNIALPALVLDFALYLGLAALVTSAIRARLPDNRITARKVVFGIFAALVYSFILLPALLAFFTGLTEVIFWIDAPGIISVEPWLGAPDYCANEGMRY